MNQKKIFSNAILVAVALAGCASPPQPKATAEIPKLASREKFQFEFDGGFSIDYQIERKISAANGKSCYAFITGTLNNQSQRTLSKQSVLDVTVLNQGKQLFRDITNPVEQILPGTRVAFGMVVSPVHTDGCPTYETIHLTLRKVFVN